MFSVFSGLLIRRAYRPKQASTKHGSATTVRPGFGSSVGCFSLNLPGKGGTPLTLGGLKRRRRQPPPAPAGLPQLRGNDRLPQKETDGPAHAHRVQPARFPRAHAARNRRSTGASCGAQNGAFPGAQNGASPGAHNGAFPSAQNGAFPGAQSSMSPDTRTSASSGAHPARLRGVRRVCFLKLFVWTLV